MDVEADTLTDLGGCYGAIEKAPLKSAGTPLACWFILVVELCERLAYYTFNGTMMFFLERMGFSLVSAGGLNVSMVSLCWVWPLVASWVADVLWGKYKTILVAGIVYVIGSGVSGIATWPGGESTMLYFMGMLFLIPVGTAGIKANLSNLGADQYDESDPAQLEAQEKFFSVYYLSINVGSFVAYGFLTTFATNGGLGVPRQFGYFVTYALAGLCMMLATGIFFTGSSRYRKIPPQKTSAIAYVANALVGFAQQGSKQALLICLGSCLLLCSVVLSVIQAFMVSPILRYVMVLCGFASAAGGLVSIVVPCLKTNWLRVGLDVIQCEEHPSESSSARSHFSKEDLIGFLEMLPPLMLGTIAFNALYNCMAFWYQQQACQMDTRVTPSIQLAGSFFNVADCLAIVVVTPLAVDWFNPLLERSTQSKLGCGSKFGMGMAVGTLSVILAVWLEILRRSSPVLSVASQCAPDGVFMSTFKAAWMVVPYFLMGVGEIYCNPTLMHFAYSRSAPSMRTLANAVYFFLQAVSNALFALLLELLRTYVPDNLNNGHLEYGYLASIGIGLVFYVLFLRTLQDGETGG